MRKNVLMGYDFTGYETTDEFKRLKKAMSGASQEMWDSWDQLLGKNSMPEQRERNVALKALLKIVNPENVKRVRSRSKKTRTNESVSGHAEQGLLQTESNRTDNE